VTETDAQATVRALVAQTHSLLLALDAPMLRPCLDVWPRGAELRSVQASQLPVLHWLPEAARAAPRFSAALLATLVSAAPVLAWRQSYTAGELQAAFLNNYGWSELAGEHGPLASQRIACGFLLLGPATLYPPHHHEAEEIYIPLAGTADWQKGTDPWREWPPGTLIHHARDEPHAMQTGNHPLLALYLWRSANLAQKAQLSRPNRT
jgi:Dimethlysulfonioproprionate lyase